MNANRTLRARCLARTIFVIRVCAVLGLASGAEASPFMLNLASSGSSGGGGGHRGSSGGAGSALGLGLNVGGLIGPLSTAGGPKLSDPSKTTASETAVESLTEAVKSTVASLSASGSLARLELGNGQVLAVSGPVLSSLVDSLSRLSTTSGDSTNTIELTQPNTDGVANHVTNRGATDLGGVSTTTQSATTDPSYRGANNPIDATTNPPSQTGLGSTVPNEIVQAAFADVVSGIISPTAGIANPSSAVAADDPIHASEPATLVLFASGLGLAARRFRRR